VNVTYLSADINPKNAMVKEDITQTSFNDDAFDIIFCSHVLEHIEDDRKAMKELFRILKPGGFAILQVPIKDTKETFEDFSVTDPKERENLFGQHDHVRLYGRDYKDRLQKAGFHATVDKFVEKLDPAIIKKYALPQESIYFCTK